VNPLGFSVLHRGQRMANFPLVSVGFSLCFNAFTMGRIHDEKDGGLRALAGLDT
jgi:hypothetical protein